MLKKDNVDTTDIFSIHAVTIKRTDDGNLIFCGPGRNDRRTVRESVFEDALIHLLRDQYPLDERP